MTASIAFDLKQSLCGIVTNANACLRMLAADPPKFESARETVRRTIRDSNRALEVVTRFATLFGSEGGATTESVDLNEATREVLALLSSELEDTSVIVRIEFAQDLPLVASNRVQLQQAILNLARNALGGSYELQHSAALHNQFRASYLSLRSSGDDRGSLGLLGQLASSLCSSARPRYAGEHSSARSHSSGCAFAMRP